MNITTAKLLVLFLLMLNNCSFSVILDHKKIAKKIDSYLHSYGNFNGVILVAQERKIIISKGYGYANYEFEIPNTPDTKFKIASLTKSFTALAILQLQESELLDVQNTISRYVPDFPNGDKITIHHLLTHTSGIPNYYSRFNELRSCASLQEIITAFTRWPLEFEPGSNYRYSNSGYLLLADIIEKVSGMSYENYLHEKIFKPLNMQNSGSDSSQLILKNRATGYIEEKKEIKQASPIDLPLTLIGNGNLYSSLEDLYVWDQALFAEKIVTKKTINLMVTPHVILPSKRAHGYGWFIDQQYNKRCVEYTGALRGFLSKHVHFIDDKITIIILTNLENQEQFCKICDNIPAIIFGKN